LYIILYNCGGHYNRSQK